MPNTGVTVLLTGLPSSGKSTLARALVSALRADGRGAEVLDGDAVRAEYWPELGFSRADREANLARIGGLARLLARNGVVVVVAAIAPFADARQRVRELHEADAVDFLEVHVDASVEVCRRRDVKGLYARQARGELAGLTGVDAPYEAPSAPDLWLDTASDTVADCCRQLAELVEKRLAQQDS